MQINPIPAFKMIINERIISAEVFVQKTMFTLCDHFGVLITLDIAAHRLKHWKDVFDRTPTSSAQQGFWDHALCASPLTPAEAYHFTTQFNPHSIISLSWRTRMSTKHKCSLFFPCSLPVSGISSISITKCPFNVGNEINITLLSYVI